MSSSMHLIVDGLWLGDMGAAYNKFMLKKNGIIFSERTLSQIKKSFISGKKT